MAKDPAFLFYYQDFAYGTRQMTFEEKGCYIELLCEQADLGHLSIEDIKRSLKTYFPIWESICCKFDKDDAGLFYNKVLEKHMINRKKFVDSRLNNLNTSHKKPHMDSHMEDVNVIINEVKNTVDFEGIWIKYPKRVGKKEAERHFKASVKDKIDEINIHTALENYLKSERVHNGFIQNGSTWFNNWRDWIEFKETVCATCKGKGKYISSTGYESICSCPRGNAVRMSKQ